MRIQNKRILIIVFLYLVITACKERSSSIIFDKTYACEAPCWHNIIPGKTTESDLQRILDDNSIGLLGEWHKYENEFTYNPVSSDEVVIEITIVEGLVSSLLFSPYDFWDLSIGIDFGKAIVLYGKPEFVLTSLAPGPGQFLWFKLGHRSWKYLVALNSDKGILFVVMKPHGTGHLSEQISPKTMLASLMFFNPADFNRMANAKGFGGDWDLEGTMERMHPWVGYGAIDELYPYIP